MNWILRPCPIKSCFLTEITVTGWRPHSPQVARLDSAPTNVAWFVRKEIHHHLTRKLSCQVLWAAAVGNGTTI